MQPISVRSCVMIPFNPLGIIREPEIPKKFTSFTGTDNDKEHIAITFGDINTNQPVLVRVHSECLTGDTFGSFLCDCRAQFHESILTLEEKGGVLLYMRQEGRGIGLYKKLEAYSIQQSEGIDTFTANERVGFPRDSRDYSVASGMLRALGIKKIILISNNPDKEQQLTKFGIDVVKRIQTKTHVSKFNRKYLFDKLQSGHQLVGLNDH